MATYLHRWRHTSSAGCLVANSTSAPTSSSSPHLVPEAAFQHLLIGFGRGQSCLGHPTWLAHALAPLARASGPRCLPPPLHRIPGCPYYPGCAARISHPGSPGIPLLFNRRPPPASPASPASLAACNYPTGGPARIPGCLRLQDRHPQPHSLPHALAATPTCLSAPWCYTISRDSNLPLTVD